MEICCTPGKGANAWHLEGDWNIIDSSTGIPQLNPYDIVKQMDSRGDITLSTSLIFGIGKTFKSGYLNIPVNLFVMPRKEGTSVGFSFGFNIIRKPKVQ